MTNDGGLVPHKIEIDNLTLNDYLGDDLHAYLWSLCDTEYDQTKNLTRLKMKAEELGYKGFLGEWQAYQRQQKRMLARPVGNVASFDGQDLELDSGAWYCTNNSIWMDGEKGDLIACTHPILPVQRLVNMDTGLEKVKLMYRPGKNWRSVIIDKSLIASNQKIITLADVGIAVTSESSKLLVKFLSEIEAMNYDAIPTGHSIGRVGWIGDNFVPYDDNIVFDGDSAHKQIFEAISQKGTLKEWVDEVKKVRKTSPLATRIMLAASFASVLVDPLNALPFYVHVWGKTGKGKTVALMMSASVWGNPSNDAYLQSFNGTQNSLEGLAGFFNSMPLILDESQLQKAPDGRIAVNVYKLADGSSKGRMTKTLGSQPKQRWRNCILTSGEQPLADASSGGGALNRVISICVDAISGNQLFNDAPAFVGFIRNHYGQAGKAFVELIKNTDMDTIKEKFEVIKKEIETRNVTEKQSMAGAIIMFADMLTSQELFKDGLIISFDEMASFLLSNDEASQEQRNYESLMDWIEINENSFDDRAVRRLGYKRNGLCLIYRKAFDEFCKEISCSPEVLLGWLKRNGKTKTSGDKTTYVVREGNKNLMRMVAVYMSEDEEMV